MASIIHAAAARTNASVAGHTYVPELPGREPGAPVAATTREVVDKVTGDGLGFLSGGFHPEHLPTVVNADEIRPTDSRPGLVGGLRPRGQGTVAPGPAGAAAAARSTLAKVRSRLKI
jgi:hypothetical protein